MARPSAVVGTYSLCGSRRLQDTMLGVLVSVPCFTVAMMSDPVAFILKTQNDAYQRGVLPIWTIYAHPKDFPDAYVARMFETGPEGEPVPTKVMLASPEIEALRAAFSHAGLTRLDRNEGDQPEIVESWI
jgi:hypothetical protein